MIFPCDLCGPLCLVGAGVVHRVVVDGVEGLTHGAVVGHVSPVDVEVVPGSVINTGTSSIVRGHITGHG